ncbi:tryptophan synthase subunit alpha [Streptomyces sp. NPDC056831]|uniref:tryptophan synthase subunit alpha n=1 Tax=Streptomyces sp. NPDC056831 TaxID=3345954 RepID=UPI0036AFCD88
MSHLPASTPLDIQLRRPYTSLGVFLPAGMTDSADEQRTIDALADSGVDLFEIGVPCRTPFLDGPVIASAHYEALWPVARMCATCWAPSRTPPGAPPSW